MFGLVYSVAIALTHHLVYRPNVGASDGLAVQLTDFRELHEQRVIRRGRVLFGLLFIALLGVGLTDKISARADEELTATLDGGTGLIGTAVNMASDSPWSARA